MMFMGVPKNYPNLFWERFIPRSKTTGELLSEKREENDWLAKGLRRCEAVLVY